MASVEMKVEGERYSLTIEGVFNRSIVDVEDSIQHVMNEAGLAMTAGALEYLDTDGSNIEIGGTIYRTKGKEPKRYHTPYGDVTVRRHVYQPSGGGATYCPMKHGGRLVRGNTTPLFARQVSDKFARIPPRDVQRDLEENHGRKVTVSLLQRISDAVAAVAQAKEEKWSYHIPELDAPVETVAVSLDGTCMLMCESGWREAMAGSLSLYDGDGNRMHTIYVGAAPEYGKAQFFQRLEWEIRLLKERYPQADFVGIADGAECNWTFLDRHTGTQILDYYHASGYLGAVAKALFPGEISKQKQWLVAACHMLKHEKDAAETLYKKMCVLEKGTEKLPKETRQGLSKAVTYFKNHKRQMDYPAYRSQNYPIGSGVIEAACKTLIKQRLCLSGMRWKNRGAAAIIALRALEQTPSRWQQFWEKIDRYGFPVVDKT